jgi:hypothetical protein
LTQLHFYATRADLLTVLTTIQSTEAIKYVQAGYADTDEFPVFYSAEEIHDLGTTRADGWTSAKRYLIMGKDVDVNIEQSMLDGRARFSIYSGINPTAVELSPSGILREGFLIYGRLANLDLTDESKRLQRKLTRIFKKHFQRVEYAFVGNEAFELLKAGWRLSQAVQNPPEYALRIPGSSTDDAEKLES